MSQPSRAFGQSAEKAGDLTPVNKQTATLGCPPAPIKEDLIRKCVVPRKPSLTSKEVHQLRESWKGLVDAVIDPCKAKQEGNQ